MNKKQALELINSVMNGNYPCSDDIYLDEFLDRPEVKEALRIAYNNMIKVDQLEQERWIPKKSRWPWYEEEDELLMSSYSRGVSINTLADYHQRSESSIRSRLSILGMR